MCCDCIVQYCIVQKLSASERVTSTPPVTWSVCANVRTITLFSSSESNTSWTYSRQKWGRIKNPLGEQKRKCFWISTVRRFDPEVSVNCYKMYKIGKDLWGISKRNHYQLNAAMRHYSTMVKCTMNHYSTMVKCTVYIYVYTQYILQYRLYTLAIMCNYCKHSTYSAHRDIK